MAVDNIKVIDGMGINKEHDAIMLLLCDHLPWEGEKAPYLRSENSSDRYSLSI